MRCLNLTFLATFVINGAAVAADWPQWLGPNRDASTTEKVAAWKGELKPEWKKPAGEGNSSPIVAGGLVYLHTKVKDKKAEMVQAFDAKTGEVKWEKTYPKEEWRTAFGSGPQATPCVVNDRLFTFGNTGVLTCWNPADGSIVWQKNTLTEFMEANLFFGISCSPIVVDDKVLVMLGKGKTGVVAFDVKDGAVAWKAGGDIGSYSSPISFGEGAKKQIVFLTGDNVLSLSPAGEVLWKHAFADSLSESSTTPVKVGDLLVVSSIKSGTVALKLTETGGKPSVAVGWKVPELTCYFSTPVAVDKDHLFMVTGIPAISGASITLRCVDTANGKESWNKSKLGQYHGALMKMGDGNILFHSDNGNLSLLAPDVKEFKELAKSKVCERTWAHPAVASKHTIPAGRKYRRQN